LADAQDTSTPANFGTFRETLLARLRSVNHSKAEFERRIKETDASVEQRMG
jgi:hypothetical protein